MSRHRLTFLPLQVVLPATGLWHWISSLVVAVFIACLGPAAAQTNGGEIVVALETDVLGFDAVKGRILDSNGATVLSTIQEPLIRMDRKTGTFHPLLALSWETTEDQTVWTFKLRPGVRHHDGTTFDSADVAHHFNRILDPANKATARTFISAIEKVVVVDALTVEFHLKHPWQALLPFLATRFMSGPIPSMENVEADKQNRHPVGTGPFRFVSWNSGDRIVVERNPDYWAADEIHLDRIVFRILPDTQTRFAALKSGEVDVIWTDRGATIVEAEKDPDIVTLKVDGPGGTTILLNTRNAPLDDPRVRAAIAHAWNQNAGIQVLWQGTRPFITHQLGEAKDCGESSYRHYDPEKARALLAEYGKPVRLTMNHTTTPRGREIGQIMQQLLGAVGIELELIPVDQTVLVKRVLTKDFDLSGWRTSGEADIGPELFGFTFSKSSYNLTGWSTPELDALGMAMRTAKTREERLDKQCEMTAAMNESGTYLFIGGGRFYAFTNKRVHGIPLPYSAVIDVTRAWIDE